MWDLEEFLALNMLITKIPGRESLESFEKFCVLFAEGFFFFFSN